MNMFKVVALSTLMLIASMELWAQPANSNPLSDLRVRQAIAYAIDMDTIAATLLEGMAIAADSRIPNGPFKAPGLNQYKYNPDKSRQLLKQANWDSSQVLDLVYYYGDQLTADLMTAVQAYLADVGIQMTFRKLEGDVGAQLNSVPKDAKNGPSAVIYNLGYGAKAALALQEYYNDFRCGRNPQVPCDDKIDALVDGINGTADIEKQKKAFFAIERYMNEMLWDYPLYYQQLFVYENKRVNRNGGDYGNAQYNYRTNIVDWTVPPNKDGKMVLYSNTGPEEFFYHPWWDPGMMLPQKVLLDRLIVADGSLTPKYPGMAKHYHLSDDGKTLNFVIYDGLTWHDGSPLTVEDIRWSVEYSVKTPVLGSVFRTTFESLKGIKAYKDGSASHISGITTKGKTSITFEFEKLDPNSLMTFSQWPPLPKKHLQDADPNKFQQHPYFQRPIGSGPYKIKKVEMNDYVVMVPFDGFHGGRAKIDEIVCYPSMDNDPDVIKNARAGKLDVGFTKNVADVMSLQKMDHMRVIPVDIPYTRILWINQYPMK